jgi:hypothetical protein
LSRQRRLNVKLRRQLVFFDCARPYLQEAQAAVGKCDRYGGPDAHLDRHDAAEPAAGMQIDPCGDHAGYGRPISGAEDALGQNDILVVPWCGKIRLLDVVHRGNAPTSGERARTISRSGLSRRSHRQAAAA